MKIVFRADASPTLGIGHVMRCLSLARQLISVGARVRFVCFSVPETIRKDILGYGCELKEVDEKFFARQERLGIENIKKSPSLSSRWQVEDAKNTIELISDCSWDWMVVDHYSISNEWEELIKKKVKRLFVIDDLANRKHSCDILLDQTLGRSNVEYFPYVLKSTRLLLGVEYAMLRPEFGELRNYSLSRRKKGVPKKLLISLGGGDLENATSKILETISSLPFIDGWNITVVLGAASPWVNEIQDLINLYKLDLKLIVNSSNMAKLMSDSDFSIGAAGSTSWERCCLGLPAILVKLAPNQTAVAKALEKAGAILTINSFEEIQSELPVLMSRLNSNDIDIQSMSDCASNIVDGYGCDRVVLAMESLI